MKKGFSLVILSAVLFGTMPFFAKQIYGMGGNSLTLCFHRFCLSIPFLYLIVRYKYKISLKITGRESRKILVLSLCCAGTPLLLFQSYRYIPSGMATTIHFVYPILVLLGCVVFYRERLTVKKSVCAALCLLGILFFYTPGESGSPAGVALAFASGVTYALYVLYYSKSGLAEMNTFKLSFYLSLVSSAGILAGAVLSGKIVYEMPPQAWLLSVLFAFIVSVVATVSFQAGTARIGPEKSSMLSTFEPLTSIAAGVVLFSEPVTPRTAFGIACILCAVILLAYGDRSSNKLTFTDETVH